MAGKTYKVRVSGEVELVDDVERVEDVDGRLTLFGKGDEIVASYSSGHVHGCAPFDPDDDRLESDDE